MRRFRLCRALKIYFDSKPRVPWTWVWEQSGKSYSILWAYGPEGNREDTNR